MNRFYVYVLHDPWSKRVEESLRIKGHLDLAYVLPCRKLPLFKIIGGVD